MEIENHEAKDIHEALTRSLVCLNDTTRSRSDDAVKSIKKAMNVFEEKKETFYKTHDEFDEG